MSFELETQIDEDGKIREFIRERKTITKIDETTKLWSKEQMHDDITELETQKAEIQERIDILKEQTEKFTPVEAIPK